MMVLRRWRKEETHDRRERIRLPKRVGRLDLTNAQREGQRGTEKAA
jgi:hypothetical protein